MKLIKKTALFSVLVLSILTLSISCDSNTDSDSTDTATSSITAPVLSGTDIMSGEEISLSDYRGKVVILNFWATWCPPCKAEIPDMVDLKEDYGDDIEIIGVSLDDMTPEYVASFAEGYEINYPVIMGTDQMTSDYGGIMSIPTTIVIDKNGNMIGKAIGARTYDDFYLMVSPYF